MRIKKGFYQTKRFKCALSSVRILCLSACHSRFYFNRINPKPPLMKRCLLLTTLLGWLCLTPMTGLGQFECGDAVSYEGHNYSTVQIGDQCWFSENCRYLPEVSPSSEGSVDAPHYYVYGYEGADVSAAQATDNFETYGVLSTGQLFKQKASVQVDGTYLQMKNSKPWRLHWVWMRLRSPSWAGEVQMKGI